MGSLQDRYRSLKMIRFGEEEGTVPIDMPLSEAKSRLSALVESVHETGAEYTVTVRDVPPAMIAPVPEPAPTKARAMGILAGKKPIATRDQEKAGYCRELEARYANPT